MNRGAFPWYFSYGVDARMQMSHPGDPPRRDTFRLESTSSLMEVPQPHPTKRHSALAELSMK